MAKRIIDTSNGIYRHFGFRVIESTQSPILNLTTTTNYLDFKKRERREVYI